MQSPVAALVRARPVMNRRLSRWKRVETAGSGPTMAAVRRVLVLKW
jgi:hypothetical protein